MLFFICLFIILIISLIFCLFLDKRTKTVDELNSNLSVFKIRYGRKKDYKSDFFLQRTCKNCNTTIEFLSNEVSCMEDKIGSHIEYINCPVCNEKIIVCDFGPVGGKDYGR